MFCKCAVEAVAKVTLAPLNTHTLDPFVGCVLKVGHALQGRISRSCAAGSISAGACSCKCAVEAVAKVTLAPLNTVSALIIEPC
jgi:hypothetical protein